jgi:hypothetical protein
MKALISTIEPRQTGYRVAQVVVNEATFPIADTMFWTDFPSDLDALLVPSDQYWYDPSNQTIKTNFTSQEVFDNVIITPAGETPY